jgi:uncharacterized protein YbaP (TraB family)
MKKGHIAAIFAALLSVAPAFANVDVAPPTQPVEPPHPALWTVHGTKGTAYLFGSLHLLPPGVDWHTKEIDSALAKANVLVFEVAMNGEFQSRLHDYIALHGLLPEGQHLRDLLSPAARSEFDAQVAGLDVSPGQLDKMRPWLAALTMQVAALSQANYSPSAGVDVGLEADAAKDSRPIIGLETVEQQLALLAPSDPAVDLQKFEAELRSAEDGPQRHGNTIVGPLVEAWMHGNVERIAELTSADMAAFPQARRAIFDDRNDAWVKQIVGLLDEDKTYFITVGAGHLAGPHGVPTLLREKGFRVDGP